MKCVRDHESLQVRVQVNGPTFEKKMIRLASRHTVNAVSEVKGTPEGHRVLPLSSQQVSALTSDCMARIVHIIIAGRCYEAFCTVGWAWDARGGVR